METEKKKGEQKKNEIQKKNVEILKKIGKNYFVNGRHKKTNHKYNAKTTKKNGNNDT